MDGTKRRGCTCRWCVSRSHNHCNDQSRPTQNTNQKPRWKLRQTTQMANVGTFNFKMRNTIWSAAHTFKIRDIYDRQINLRIIKNIQSWERSAALYFSHIADCYSDAQWWGGRKCQINGILVSTSQKLRQLLCASVMVLFKRSPRVVLSYKSSGRAALCPQNDKDKLPQLVRHAHRCKSVVIVNESD